MNVILQGPALQPAHIEHAAALVRSTTALRLSAQSVQLSEADVQARGALADWCAEQSLDAAWLDARRPLSSCRVLALDMDSTLINIECIDEIADMAGRKQEVAAITEAAMRGEITDFADSLRRRVALLAGVGVDALEQVWSERLRLNPGAQALLTTAHDHGVRTMLVSGGFTFFAERVRDVLGLPLDHVHANVLEIEGGRLTGRVVGDIVDGAYKAARVRALADELGASPEQIIVAGDGANDLPMMAAAHYSVAYRAKPVVRAQAHFALNVSPLDGILDWFVLDQAEV